MEHNGFEYIDLGLRSGTLWATCNVGSDKPWDIGLYFQWGDALGYGLNDIENGIHSFNQGYRDYIFHDGRGGMLKYNWSDYQKTLYLEDDAASIYMGGDWSMPSRRQIMELMEECKSEWVENYMGKGVNGKLFFSRNNDGKTIFIPALGFAINCGVQSFGDNGLVWTKTRADAAGQASYFCFGDEDKEFIATTNRCFGFSVRGVLSKKS